MATKEQKEQWSRARIARKLGLYKRGQPLPSDQEMIESVGADAFERACEDEELRQNWHDVGGDEARFAPADDQDLAEQEEGH